MKEAKVNPPPKHQNRKPQPPKKQQRKGQVTWGHPKAFQNPPPPPPKKKRQHQHITKKEGLGEDGVRWPPHLNLNLPKSKQKTQTKKHRNPQKWILSKFIFHFLECSSESPNTRENTLERGILAPQKTPNWTKSLL